MKKYRLTLDLEFIVEAPDDADDDDIVDALAERIALNNETVENIFWESIECEEVADDEGV